jgi:hypothetical protein
MPRSAVVLQKLRLRSSCLNEQGQFREDRQISLRWADLKGDVLLLRQV